MRVFSPREDFFLTVALGISSGDAVPSIFHHFLRFILRLCLGHYFRSRRWLPVVIQELHRGKICHYPADAGICFVVDDGGFYFRRWWRDVNGNYCF